MDTKDMSNVACIREYFKSGKSGQVVTMSELKDLSTEARAELGEMCREALEKDWK